MKYIIGLGNPTTEYRNTRHNIGQDLIFMLEDELVDDIVFMNPFKLHRLPGYINDSGLALKKLFKNIKPDSENENLLIIHDDLDQPLGKIKMVYDGNSGGHNGINSIYSHLKTKKYYRLKIGISPEVKLPAGEVHDFVLGKFSKAEADVINGLRPKIVQVIKEFVKGDVGRAIELANKK
jgi:PTH1 family peptidyl-tRNA hydrolase